MVPLFCRGHGGKKCNVSIGEYQLVSYTGLCTVFCFHLISQWCPESSYWSC